MAESTDMTGSLSGIETKSTEEDWGETVSDAAWDATGPINSAKGMGESVADMLKGDKDATELATGIGSLAMDAKGFVSECAEEATSIATDPVGWLIGKGLDFLLTIFQPLQDALNFVTGDAEALKTAASNFDAIGNGLATMAQDFVKEADETLSDWQGDAAKAARARLAQFADGINGTAQKGGNVSQMLQLSSMIMTVIHEVIMAIITELVTWLVMIWIPALVAAVFTVGASTAAAGTATAVKVPMSVSKATGKVSKVQKLINTIKRWIEMFRQRMGKALSEAASKETAQGKRAKQVLGKNVTMSKGEFLPKSFTEGLKESGKAGWKKFQEETIGATTKDLADPEKRSENRDGMIKKGLDYWGKAHDYDKSGSIGTEELESDEDTGQYGKTTTEATENRLDIPDNH